jgi:poly-gamma-glutamate synthesis protein (capsule biosynthesis protein)
MNEMLDAGGRARFSDGAAAVRLLAAGDLCPIGRLEEPLVAGRPADAFGDCLSLFERADLAVVNLESPLCETESPIPKCGPNFRARPGVAGGLAAAGVDLACLANNHILDQGPVGLDETLAALDRAGIRRLGAGSGPAPAAEPLFVEAGGLRLALLNVAEGEFCRAEDGPGAAPLDLPANCRAVAAAADAADLVLCFVHAGNEQILFPSPRVRRLGRELIDAGAAAVVAHHPHVPQGIERYRDRPIAYSLGNFLFDWSEHEPETDTSFLLELDLAPGGVAALAVHPFGKTRDGGARLLAGRDHAAFLDLLNDLSAPLSDPAEMAALWDEQCVGLLETRYAGKFERIARLVEADCPDRARLERLAYGLVHCEAHHETVTHILRLRLRDRFHHDPARRKHLDALMSRLQAFAQRPDGSRAPL